MIMEHPVIQAIAATTTISTVIGLMPVIVGIPAAIYYLLLVIEKLTGKPINKLFTKCDCKGTL